MTIDTILRQQNPQSLDSQQIAGLRYMIEGRGYSMLGWSMEFEANRYRFSTGHNYLGQDLEIMLGIKDSEIAKLNFQIPDNRNDKTGDRLDSRLPEYCSTLKSLSLQALANTEAAVKVQSTNVTFPHAFQRCAECHTTNRLTGTPYIDFANPANFKKMVMENGLWNKIRVRIGDHTNTVIMPPVQPSLTQSEVDEISKYLGSLGLN